MILGLMGKQGAGKDAVAEILADYGYTRQAFADPVRDMAIAIDPILDVDYDGGGAIRLSEVVDQFGWDISKREIKEVRRLLQAIGTDGVRDIIGEDTWVDLAMRLASERSGHTVFTDVRFPNEAQAIIDNNGLIVEVIRPGAPDTVNANHASEQWDGYISVDYTIINDGTLDDLRRAVEGLMV